MGKWHLTFRAVRILVGFVLGLTLVSVIRGEFNLSVLLGAIAAVCILFIANLIKIRMQKDGLPETDERIKNNILKLFVFSSQIFIGLTFISLSIMMFTNVEAVALSYLWIIMISYLLITGIGAFIVSKK